MKISKVIFITVGCICLALGTVGIVLPILPTVPFFMATAFCFAKSSERLHSWFVSSNMYKKHLQSFVEKRGMLMKTKLTILTTVTLLMGFGFVMMSRVPVARVILAVVWVCHVVYFVFGVKTIREEE
ncbi:YbaN family protein [uncultured Ruminococcus sp.]|uniref:YbaN family protein n=1 Tax=uncultured Ruminococcus sp. TaxID=165186 RepID=UPI0026701714|nr:YbaN family protein [uncultured Ruminococcus sp.]